MVRCFTNNETRGAPPNRATRRSPMSSPPSPRAFVLDQLLDDHARVPAVLGRDATDVITPDRTLRDAALALLVLPGPGESELVTRLLAALREFTDPDHPGFRELLDVTGAPHPV